MADANIKAQLENLMVTTPMKEYVSRMLVREWKSLGRRLLSTTGREEEVEAALTSIAIDNYNNVRQCCYLMLSEWQNKMASKATAGRLIEALNDIGQKLLVDNLEKTILNPCQTENPPLSPPADGTPMAPFAKPPVSQCPPEIKNQPIKIKHKKHVYLNIGQSWDELGEELGLNKDCLRRIENETDSLTIRCKNMFKEWEKLNEHRTVGELEEALLRIYEGKLANELVSL